MKEFLEKVVGVAHLLEPYPAWTKILVAAWVLLTAAVIISMVFARPAKTDESRIVADPHSQGAASAASQTAAILNAESVEALRRSDGVRPLRTLENELNINRLPAGVYGFTVPWIINTDSTGVVGGTGVDRISLQQSSGGTAVMEIHKSAAGTIYVTGYVSETDLVRLQNPSRVADAEVTLFFTPYREFSLTVAIPISRIKTSDNRSVGDQYVNDLSVH